MSKELLQSVARGALFSVVAMGLVSLTPISAVAQDAGTSPNGQVQVPPASATQDIPGVDPKALVDGPLSPDAPALQYLRSRGNVLRFMGRLHGLDAYFAKAANGSIQTFYISPDGNAAIAGLMFNIQGQNITMGRP